MMLNQRKTIDTYMILIFFLLRLTTWRVSFHSKFYFSRLVYCLTVWYRETWAVLSVSALTDNTSAQVSRFQFTNYFIHSFVWHYILAEWLIKCTTWIERNNSISSAWQLFPTYLVPSENNLRSPTDVRILDMNDTTGKRSKLSLIGLSQVANNWPSSVMNVNWGQFR